MGVMAKFRLVQNAGAERSAIRVVRPKLKDLGREILSDAQRAAPVDTGELRDSGDTEITPEGTLRVGFTSDHAKFVSDGTSRMAPNPFLKQALFKRRADR